MRLHPSLLATFLVATSPAFAADIQCYGTVTDLLVYSDGTVNILTSYRNDYTNICNLQVARQGVDTFTCALWIGSIESARKLGQTIHVYYIDNGTGFSCATIPIHGAAPAPLFIGH
jgi:hypothetical protein